MKKTSQSQVRQLPISQKAYENFRERIKRINNWYALDATNMLRMLDDYLAGDSEPGGGASLIHNIAFLFLREEIDRAMARSTRVRENARRRRERKEQERKEQERKEAAAAAARMAAERAGSESQEYAAEASVATQDIPQSDAGLRDVYKSVKPDRLHAVIARGDGRVIRSPWPK